MKPTNNQKALIEYFIEKLETLYDMDVSDYDSDIDIYIQTIERELMYNRVDCEAMPADAIRDLIRTIIINR